MSDLRPVTKSLLNAIHHGGDLSPAVLNDFGLTDLPQKFALVQAVYCGWITPEQLDAVLGDGPRITELVAESNPYFSGLVYETPWDILYDRVPPLRQEPEKGEEREL